MGSKGVLLVVSCNCSGLQYTCVPVAPARVHQTRVMEILEPVWAELQKEHGVVLLHCRSGIVRSAAAAAALMMLGAGVTLHEARDFIARHQSDNSRVLCDLESFSAYTWLASLSPDYQGPPFSHDAGPSRGAGPARGAGRPRPDAEELESSADDPEQDYGPERAQRAIPERGAVSTSFMQPSSKGGPPPARVPLPPRTPPPGWTAAKGAAAPDTAVPPAKAAPAAMKARLTKAPTSAPAAAPAPSVRGTTAHVAALQTARPKAPAPKAGQPPREAQAKAPSSRPPDHARLRARSRSRGSPVTAPKSADRDDSRRPRRKQQPASPPRQLRRRVSLRSRRSRSPSRMRDSTVSSHSPSLRKSRRKHSGEGDSMRMAALFERERAKRLAQETEFMHVVRSMQSLYGGQAAVPAGCAAAPPFYAAGPAGCAAGCAGAPAGYPAALAGVCLAAPVGTAAGPAGYAPAPCGMYMPCNPPGYASAPCGMYAPAPTGNVADPAGHHREGRGRSGSSGCSWPNRPPRWGFSGPAQTLRQQPYRHRWRDDPNGAWAMRKRERAARHSGTVVGHPHMRLESNDLESAGPARAGPARAGRRAGPPQAGSAPSSAKAGPAKTRCGSAKRRNHTAQKAVGQQAEEDEWAEEEAAEE